MALGRLRSIGNGVKGQDGLKRLHEHIGESLALGARGTGGNQSRKEKAAGDAWCTSINGSIG